MKKRRIKWPYGNPSFVAYEVEAAAGLLVARRNHALVSAGTRLCQGWDLWLDGKFAGALSSRTLQDLATLTREELLRATRDACCGRHREFSPSNRVCHARAAGRDPMPDAVPKAASSASNSVSPSRALLWI